jgi:hypothetical protein
VKTPPGRFFHRDTFNPGFTRAGRHAHIWISMVLVCICSTMCISAIFFQH